ncbi:type III-D CRISPR-associated protein Csx19 [Thermoanaerobacterium thermosaccharolyticum]|uniref:type III-D CRISPR-associated protein Csx19 n=1 Tax=Thermoanaerobacterium thermosaccharolyticum TaxID=1517 RepID=UPI00104E1E17|nr:CRISPR-associated protein Csx19 [Thermoanaerobacterium thermosaccharolyticum]KAA5805720.1 TIGR03984 family CRISPR-associated protein [Thermoanaerobacterium thermosaccharolyticum]TCW32481.1 CRISPR-associated protein (TIGR03984 family) [Thermohydrogenium kirishiense]
MLDDIYKIGTIRSKVEAKDMDNELNNDGFIQKVEEIENGYAVCWLDYAVLFGIIQNGKVKFYDNELPDFKKYLQKLRVFNEKKEIHIWRSGNKFRFRSREDEDSDGEGTKIEYIDAQQIMYGNKFEVNDAFIEVYEDRGIRYIVPKEFIGNNSIEELNKNENRLVLHTRNYIDYNEIGQASFVDSRFLKISVI